MKTLTATQMREYRKRRAENIRARDSLAIAREKVGARFPWNHEGTSANVPQHGFDVVVRVENDDWNNVGDWIGDFSNDWKRGAIKHSDSSREYRWFHPAVTEEEHYDSLRAMYYGKATARELAREYARRDYRRAMDFGNGWWLISVNVRVLRHGVELASDSLSGIESDCGIEHIESTALDMIPVAIEEARETIERLCESR